MNDSADNDAPPISPPSTFAPANNSFAFPGLQLPPYRMVTGDHSITHIDIGDME